MSFEISKKAFSVKEIVIVFFIVLLLLIIVLSYFGAAKQNTINGVIISDLGKIDIALKNYLSEKNSLPEANGNKNYFDEKGDYSEEKSFGVNGFIGNNFLSEKYIVKIPVDTRNNQNFAYGKTEKGNKYQIAGVTVLDGEFITKTLGNYDEINNYLHGLIREYNGPNFIYNNSKLFFPYNPTEKQLVAKINNISENGKVQIITKSGKIIKNKEKILNYNLEKGDIIKTDYGTKATIFFSDGSISVLEENSELILENMDYKEEDNLFTRIKLTLNSGVLWTKATKLGNESEFAITNQDTTAAVRGTIFAVKYRGGKTSITTKNGEVKVKSKSINKIVKTGEFIGEKIKYNEFIINRPDIIYDPVSGYIIKNK